MLAMLETGDRRGSDATKIAVANYYGVSVDHIFFGSNITKRDKEDKWWNILILAQWFAMLANPSNK